MGTLTFYDAAFPPPDPPDTDGVCFYIGGDTPHVWTTAEISAQKNRYRLPVFVRSNPESGNAFADVEAAVSALSVLNAPKSTLVAWDTETAADASYISAVYESLKSAGYVLIVYGTQSDVMANDNPDGLYWGAQWTGQEHIAAGDEMTQFVSFSDIDESVAISTLPFWDTQPGAAPGSQTSWEVPVASFPETSSGATGTVVRTIQGLCCARGHTVPVDGVFGGLTVQAVTSVQQAAKISADGVVGPKTWPALLGL